MSTPDVFQALSHSTLTVSAAVMAVLALRHTLRRAFGATVAYGAWALVPVAMIAAVLPSPSHPAMAVPMMRVVGGAIARMQMTPGQASIDWRIALVIAWIVGVLAATAWFTRQQKRFRKRLGALQHRADGLYQAQGVDGLPAAIGLWKPLIVLPADFDSRYGDAQRALMIAHERMHVVHGDLYANAFATAIRCVFWFNPLLHAAAGPFRQDQELACDQRVISRYPSARREYGEAMFKTQVTRQALPLGCHWGSHPLKERIAMLKGPVPSLLRWIAGSALIAALAFGVGLTAWATQSQAGIGGRTVSLDMDKVTLLDAARQVAGKAGLRLANPEVLHSSRRLTFRLANEPLDEVLASLGDVVGLVPQVADGEIRFVRAGASSPSSSTAPEVMSIGRMPPPVYPEQARKLGIDGRVVLQVDVAADGTPEHIDVVSAEPAGVFDQASVDAAKSWRFDPKLENGRPVSYRVRVPVAFKAAAANEEVTCDLVFSKSPGSQPFCGNRDDGSSH